MSRNRFIRTATLVSTIAIALTACGPAASDSDSAAPAPTENAPTTVAPEAPADTGADADEAPKTDAPEGTAPVPAPTPIAAPAPAPAPTVPEHRRCTVVQAPDGFDYFVSGIKADDAHGGLTARVNAGYTYEAQGLLLEGAVVTSYADEADFPSCLVTRDGGVWWEVFSLELGTSLWVNSSYLEPHFAEHGPDEFRPDGPAAPAPGAIEVVCFTLPDAPNSCIFGEVQDGNIIGVDLSLDTYEEVLYSCVYQANETACLLHEADSPGQDIGVHLPLIPKEQLVLDCANGFGGAQKIACAELALRP